MYKTLFAYAGLVKNTIGYANNNGEALFSAQADEKLRILRMLPSRGEAVKAGSKNKAKYKTKRI